MSSISIGELKDFVESFFGESESDSSLGPNARVNGCEDLFLDASVGGRDDFIFSVGRHSVCEASAAFLLGFLRINDDGQLGKVTGTWKRAKSNVLDAKKNGIDLRQLRGENSKMPSVCDGVVDFLFSIFGNSFSYSGGRGDKGTQARAWIEEYKKDCDSGPVPDSAGCSLHFVPFLTVRNFYEEYDDR